MATKTKEKKTTKKPPTKLQRFLRRIAACKPAKQWVGKKTAQEAWDKCRQPSWLTFVCYGLGIEHWYAARECDDVLGIRSWHRCNLKPKDGKRWCNEFRKRIKRPTFPKDFK